MKKLLALLGVVLSLAVGQKILAFSPADLAIIEIKMTGSESVVIENTSGSTINLQNYIVEYFNKSSGINFNVPTSSQQLPNFSLQNHQSFLLSGDTTATCGAAGEANLNMSLSDSNGYFEIVKASGSGGSILYTPQDHVSWTSSASGSGIDLLSVPSATADPASVWYRKLTDGSWNKAEIDTTPCNLFVSIDSSGTITYTDWASGAQAPATIVAAPATTSGIPLADIGLAAPQITELLPNPAGTGNDSTDEYVEIYNPNSTSFDLSGFTIEVGLTSKHDYTFDPGTFMAPNSFTAFYSSDTSLSLSNSSGQAWLLDPAGHIISQTDAYKSAKDGQAWALAKRSWQWTLDPTPNAPNVIVAPASSGSKTKTTPTGGNPVTLASSTGSGSAISSSSSQSASPIHTWTLAGVGVAALAYAGYEYRADLANNVYRLRRYYAARTAAGGGVIPASVGGTLKRFGRWQNYLHGWLSQRFKK